MGILYMILSTIQAYLGYMVQYVWLCGNIVYDTAKIVYNTDTQTL